MKSLYTENARRRAVLATINSKGPRELYKSTYICDGKQAFTDSFTACVLCDKWTVSGVATKEYNSDSSQMERDGFTYRVFDKFVTSIHGNSIHLTIGAEALEEAISDDYTNTIDDKTFIAIYYNGHTYWLDSKFVKRAMSLLSYGDSMDFELSLSGEHRVCVITASNHPERGYFLATPFRLMKDSNRTDLYFVAHDNTVPESFDTDNETNKELAYLRNLLTRFNKDTIRYLKSKNTGDTLRTEKLLNLVTSEARDFKNRYTCNARLAMVEELTIGLASIEEWLHSNSITLEEVTATASKEEKPVHAEKAPEAVVEAPKPEKELETIASNVNNKNEPSRIIVMHCELPTREDLKKPAEAPETPEQTAEPATERQINFLAFLLVRDKEARPAKVEELRRSNISKAEMSEMIGKAKSAYMEAKAKKKALWHMQHDRRPGAVA